MQIVDIIRKVEKKLMIFYLENVKVLTILIVKSILIKDKKKTL